jgi:large conductance mechanosensitive channel
VNDVLKQFIAAIVGKPDFSYVVIDLHGTPIRIGNFLTASVQFLIVAAVVYFGVVLPLNTLLARIKKPAPPPPPVTKPCPQCLSDIPLAATRCAHCTQPVPAA